MIYCVVPAGAEPAASAFSRRRSTTELQDHAPTAPSRNQTGNSRGNHDRSQCGRRTNQRFPHRRVNLGHAVLMRGARASASNQRGRLRSESWTRTSVRCVQSAAGMPATHLGMAVAAGLEPACTGSRDRPGCRQPTPQLVDSSRHCRTCSVDCGCLRGDCSRWPAGSLPSRTKSPTRGSNTRPSPYRGDALTN
jgi:hypothetical protein